MLQEKRLRERLKSVPRRAHLAPNGSWASDRQPKWGTPSGFFAPNGSWVIHRQPLVSIAVRLAVDPPSALGGKPVRV
jgi:hypothetical protein